MQNISSVVEVNKDIFTRGCIEAITEKIAPHIPILAYVCIGIAIIQVSNIILFPSDHQNKQANHFDLFSYSFHLFLIVIAYVFSPFTAGPNIGTIIPLEWKMIDTNIAY